MSACPLVAEAVEAMLKEEWSAKETVGLAKGGQPYQATPTKKEGGENIPTLSDAGIDWKLSSRAQKLADDRQAKRAC